MKIYQSSASPNSRRVRIFLAEKGIDLTETRVDMMQREHKSPEFRAKNSMGQLPTLELDDGTCISETVAICRYFDETKADPPMFGTTPVEKALHKKERKRYQSAQELLDALTAMAEVQTYHYTATVQTLANGEKTQVYREGDFQAPDALHWSTVTGELTTTLIWMYKVQ